ncbi:hypothetical protein L6Q96_23675, partial [Candidatus Binatia bacterium]|nr:hypothetical protein [Candidatus Binatia bacterium]
DLPDQHGDIEFVSLRQPGEYPMSDGQVVSSKGIDASQDQFEVDENLREGLGHGALSYALSGLGVHDDHVDPGRCPGLVNGRPCGAE